MKCPICGNLGRNVFRGKIMRKYEIQYYQCAKCGFLYTEKPYWIEEAYKDSITNVDTGIMQRTIDNALVTNVIINSFYNRNAFFLDYGGGYGIFTRMMRDLGYDWLWYDKYSKNLVARGFEFGSLDKIELISAFELFEHFEKPQDELERLFSISKSVLFSTLIYDEGLAYKPFEEWWYYVPETGQHISFYSKRTLEYIAEKYHVYYYMISSGLHLFTDKKLNRYKLKLICNTKMASFLQYHIYRKARRRGLAGSDMKTVLEMRNKSNTGTDI